MNPLPHQLWLLIASFAACCLSCGSAPASNDEAVETGNVCEVDSDCGEGSCVSGRCKARGSRVKRVLVETTPLMSVSTGEYGDIRYLQERQVGEGSTLDVELDVVAELTVGVKPPSAECAIAGADPTGYIPIKVNVYQDTRINGISVTLKAAESDPTRAEMNKGNLAAVALAPGVADLHIDPTVLASDGSTQVSAFAECALAPVLVKGQSIQAGRVMFEHHLLPAKHVEVDVRTIAGEGESQQFDGWILDMVEPIDGRRISSRQVLSAPTLGSDGKLHYLLRLAYNDVVSTGGEKLGTELFRLTPPSGTLAPKRFIARSALDLFGAESVVLPYEVSLTSPVLVHGLVEAADSGKPLAADLIAELDSGSNDSTGLIAQYQAVSTSDAQGRFEIELVPGSYRVTAVPKDGATYALQTSTWSVAATPKDQSGRLVTIPASASLTGVVRRQNQNQPLANATILAVPSRFGKRPTFLDRLLRPAEATGVRSQMGMTDEDGSFDLPLDPGVYDVTVRPPEESGYPWAVLPNTTIKEAGQSLTNIEIGNPVAYSGKVTVPGLTPESPRVAMPGALVRFYALVGDTADPAAPTVSAVEIGQTRADSGGRYRLLLPDRLD